MVIVRVFLSDYDPARGSGQDMMKKTRVGRIGSGQEMF